MQPKISVIVPIYNVEKYLNKCIESIVNQTYKNLEIILVDDGSPDNCPTICEEWAKKDDRIIVLHKENGGLSDARNAGLSIATGEYVCFVDSDDWISIQYVESLMNVMIEEDCDVVECNFIKTFNDKVENSTNTLSNVYIHCMEDAMKLHLEDKMYKQVVWNKLYKKSIVNVFFEKGKFHEDVFWTYQIIYQCNKLGHIDLPLYYYYQRENSIMGETYSLKRLDAIEGYEKRYNFIANNLSQLKGIAQKGLINTYMYHSQLMLESKIENCDTLINEFSFKVKKLGNEWKNYTINKHKIWILLFALFPITTCKIRTFLKIGC